MLTEAGERALLFHARGGSIARGGGRLVALVRAAPAGAVDGTLRIREQALVINVEAERLGRRVEIGAINKQRNPARG